MELITINDAAEVSGKSIQTIRRMIKQKKIRVKRQKTPQGFQYFIIKESLLEFLAMASQMYSQEAMNSQSGSQSSGHSTNQNITREQRSLANTTSQTDSQELKGGAERFAMTIQKFIEQNEKDKENFFQLIKTFQARNQELENQIKLLQAPPAAWWKFW